MLLNYEIHGAGEPVVLLHGMAGSARYWQRLIAEAPADRYRFIALDLLGFGRSPMPRGVTYDYKTHLESIFETLAALNLHGAFSIVGHSMGALLALRMAAAPTSFQVTRAVLCNLPYYETAAEAHADITHRSRIRELAFYGPTSQALCTVWCSALRPVSRHIAPWYLRTLPTAAAEDSVLHIWQSYAQSLHNVVEQQAVMGDLKQYTGRIALIYGASDTSATAVEQVPEITTAANIKLVRVERAGHHVPITEPGAILRELNGSTPPD